jgi:AcrR family transcriptional regulator
MNVVPSKTSAPTARERLLEAAARMFAEQGFEGATTRQIAQAAGVNEVTLFRLFQSKENLQAAVLQRVFDQQAELLATQPAPSCRGLHAELLRLARIYVAVLNQNLPLVRMLIGEIHRHREHEKRVLKGIFAPIKAELISTIEAASRSGAALPDINPIMAADMLVGMLFTETLRRGTPLAPEYSHEHYLAACVETFTRGIVAAAPSLQPA